MVINGVCKPNLLLPTLMSGLYMDILTYLLTFTCLAPYENIDQNDIETRGIDEIYCQSVG